eukprot:jgi/Chlat1/1872/Chrsp141S02177
MRSIVSPKFSASQPTQPYSHMSSGIGCAIANSEQEEEDDSDKEDRHEAQEEAEAVQAEGDQQGEQAAVASPQSLGTSAPTKPKMLLEVLSHVILLLSVVFLFLVLIASAQRILRLPKSDRTIEQVVVLSLVLDMACYVMALVVALTVVDRLRASSNAAARVNEVVGPLPLAFNYVYWLAQASLQRHLLPAPPRALPFLLPKLLFGLAYYAIRVALGMSVDVNTGGLPIVYAIPAIRVLTNDIEGNIAKVAVAFILLAVDLLAISALLWSFAKTRKRLRSVPYNRVKVLSHNLFALATGGLWATIIIVAVVVLAVVPMDTFQRPGVTSRFDSFAGPPYLLLGLVFLIIAWYNPNWDWTWDMERTQMVSYSLRERWPSKDLEFCLETCVLALNFAWLAYRSRQTVVRKLLEVASTLRAQYTLLAAIEDKTTDTHVLVAKSADRLVIAFRGTSSLINAHSNAKFALIELPTARPLNTQRSDAVAISIQDASLRGSQGQHEDTAAQEAVEQAAVHIRSTATGTARVLKMWGRRVAKQEVKKVHTGFCGAWQSVAAQVLNVVETEQRSKRLPVLVCGHSLGGALAMLCAYDLRMHASVLPGELFVYTFGAPRVGNLALAAQYNSLVPNTFRLVHARDTVTKVPLVVFGFKHAGRVVLLNARNSDLLVDPAWTDLAILHNLASSSTQYHLLVRYRDALERWYNKAHASIGGSSAMHLQFWWTPAASITRRTSSISINKLKQAQHVELHASKDAVAHCTAS